jgi:hypothetical protein
MPAYDFQGLSDADFEELVGDLLGAALGVRFQIFTAGRDGGIDLLLGIRAAKGVVVQCKHFWRSGFSKLKAEFAKKVLPKVRKLDPKRYIVATSVGLTPTNKQELLQILEPHCLGLDDIYGRDDLNLLLRNHPDVETAHHKLWLTSTAVLQRVLHQGNAVWNALTKAEIERKMSLYVQTKAYGVALEFLKVHNYCVISGIPGIGKTTLAQVLLARLLEDGFELIAVRDDIGAALQGLDLSKRQVVYYDDFLGQSSLGERLRKNEDRTIVRLLQEAKASKNLKVILTTREYILNDARRVYEPLSGFELEIAKCIVAIEDYTRGHRARILYNHVYFSDLASEYAAALVKDHAYREIIDHKNYNPRIVEWMTSPGGRPPVRKFASEFVKTLDNPLRVWEHAFNNQIGHDAQAILLCLASVTGTIGIDELRTAWRALVDPSQNPIVTRPIRDRFQSALKLIDGSFVRSERYHDLTGVSFHNPSIRDYVLRRLANDKEAILELLGHAQFFDQVDCLLRLDKNGQMEFEPLGHVGDCLLLRDAVRRTKQSPSPVLYREQRRADEPTFWRASVDFGDRISTIARWYSVFKADWLGFTCAIVNDLIDGGNFAKVATAGATGFLERVIERDPPDGGSWASLVRRLIDKIGDRIRTNERPDEWARWSGFIKENKALFSEEAFEGWHGEALAFCKNYADTIFGSGYDLSVADAENDFDELKSTAKAWGFTLAEEQKKFDEWLSERGSDDDDDDRWEGGGGSSPGRDVGGTDRDLDKLFGSLLGRDGR